MNEVLALLEEEKEAAEQAYEKSLELNGDVIERGKRAQVEVQRHAEKSRQISAAIELIKEKTEAERPL